MLPKIKCALTFLALIVCLAVIIRGYNVLFDGLYSNLLSIQFLHQWSKDRHSLDADVPCVGDSGRLTVFDPIKLDRKISPHLISGFVFWVNGECEAAASEWKQLVQLQTRNSIAWYWLGIAEAGLGHFDSAAQAIRSAKAEERVVLLAIQANESQDMSAVHRWLTVAAKTGRAFPAVERAVHKYLSIGRRADAVRIFEEFSKALPEDTPEYWLALGWVELSKGDYAAALRHFERGLQKNPYDAALLYAARTALLNMGDYRQALEIALRELELSADKAQARLTIAQIYRLLQEYEEAEKWAVEAGNANPKWWAVYYELGQVYCQERKGKLALESFDHALQLSPGQLEVLVARTTCLYELGETMHAKQSAEQIIEKYGNDPRVIDLYLSLGQWYTKDGDLEQARQLYERGLRIWPQAYWFQSRLEELQHGIKIKPAISVVLPHTGYGRSSINLAIFAKMLYSQSVINN